MIVADSHNDFFTVIKTENKIKKYLKNNQNDNLSTIFCAIFTTKNNISIKKLKKYKIIIKKINKKGVFIKKANNLNKINKLEPNNKEQKNAIIVKNNNSMVNKNQDPKIENLQNTDRKLNDVSEKKKLIFAIEDIGFTNRVEDIVKLAPDFVTLTWNDLNVYAGGAYTNLGLTALGKSAVKILEENNIIVDTAHLSRRAFNQFAGITTKPIFCSHANIDSLFKNRRNLTDKQIEKIVSSNGYLGLTIYKDFITQGEFSSQDIANQIHYLIDKFGYLNFGIGTDMFGISKDKMPSDISCYQDFEKVKQYLLNMGHCLNEIEHIFHINLENYLKRVNKQ